MMTDQAPESDTDRLSRIERELALFQTAFDEIPDAIVLKDEEGNFLLCNQAVARLYNTTPELMKGKHDGDFGVPKEMAEGFRKNVQGIMARGKTEIVFEDSRDAITGEIRNFKSIKRPFKDAEGRNQILVIAHDITDVVQAQQRVAVSERRLRDVMAATREGIWDWHIATGTVLHNDEWYRMLGFSEGEIGDSIEGYSAQIHPEDKPAVWAKVQALIEGKAHDYYSEHRMICKDGSVIWVLDRGRIAEYADAPDSSRKPLRVVGSVIEITERIQSREHIAGLMAQLDMILALSPDGIAYFDEAGKIAFTNQAFEDLTGIGRDEVAGISWPQFFQRFATQTDPKHPLPASLLEDGQMEETSPLIHLQEPERRILQLSMHTPRQGNIRVIYMRDVTREIDVDQMKSDFLSTAAHELRTPMTSILGFVELLRVREFDRERTSAMLETIHKQTKRLTDLVNELLDLARIEARGGKIFNLQPASLADIIRDSINALNVNTGADRLSLALPAEMPIILADPAKLQQALLNILSNAHKYSPDGGIIEVAINYRQRNRRQQIGIMVRDHGLGMSAEDLGRVFERFFRADRSCNLPGTGLGMALAKEVITAHEGQIELDSELGQGTLVTIWLPLPNPPLSLPVAAETR